MKKRSKVLVALSLSLALCFGGALSVSANTYEGVAENKAESTTYTFTKDVQKGKYKLVDTEELKGWIDNGEKMIVIDTMPAGSYTTSNGHVPGAINAEAGTGVGEKAYNFTDEQKANMNSQIENLLPDKKVTKTTWKKTTKAKYKKLSKANRKKKGGKYYKKVVTTSTVKDKSYKIVTYCGFIGCARSHAAAAYLVEQGYTNVYRYGGGILAWKDAGYEAEFPAPVEEAP